MNSTTSAPRRLCACTMCITRQNHEFYNRYYYNPSHITPQEIINRQQFNLLAPVLNQHLANVYKNNALLAPVYPPPPKFHPSDQHAEMLRCLNTLMSLRDTPKSLPSIRAQPPLLPPQPPPATRRQRRQKLPLTTVAINRRAEEPVRTIVVQLQQEIPTQIPATNVIATKNTHKHNKNNRIKRGKSLLDVINTLKLQQQSNAAARAADKTTTSCNNNSTTTSHHYEHENYMHKKIRRQGIGNNNKVLNSNNLSPSNENPQVAVAVAVAVACEQKGADDATITLPANKQLQSESPPHHRHETAPHNTLQHDSNPNNINEIPDDNALQKIPQYYYPIRRKRLSLLANFRATKRRKTDYESDNDNNVDCDKNVESNLTKQRDDGNPKHVRDDEDVVKQPQECAVVYQQENIDPQRIESLEVIQDATMDFANFRATKRRKSYYESDNDHDDDENVESNLTKQQDDDNPTDFRDDEDVVKQPQECAAVVSEQENVDPQRIQPLEVIQDATTDLDQDFNFNIGGEDVVFNAELDQVTTDENFNVIVTQKREKAPNVTTPNKWLWIQEEDHTTTTLREEIQEFLTFNDDGVRYNIDDMDYDEVQANLQSCPTASNDGSCKVAPSSEEVAVVTQDNRRSVIVSTKKKTLRCRRRAKGRRYFKPWKNKLRAELDRYSWKRCEKLNNSLFTFYILKHRISMLNRLQHCGDYSTSEHRHFVNNYLHYTITIVRNYDEYAPIVVQALKIARRNHFANLQRFILPPRYYPYVNRSIYVKYMQQLNVNVKNITSSYLNLLLVNNYALMTVLVFVDDISRQLKYQNGHKLLAATKRLKYQFGDQLLTNVITSYTNRHNCIETKLTVLRINDLIDVISDVMYLSRLQGVIRIANKFRDTLAMRLLDFNQKFITHSNFTCLNDMLRLQDNTTTHTIIELNLLKGYYVDGDRKVLLNLNYIYRFCCEFMLKRHPSFMTLNQRLRCYYDEIENFLGNAILCSFKRNQALCIYFYITCSISKYNDFYRVQTNPPISNNKNVSYLLQDFYQFVIDFNEVNGGESYSFEYVLDNLWNGVMFDHFEEFYEYVKALSLTN